jgi:hypothetical protein
MKGRLSVPRIRPVRAGRLTVVRKPRDIAAGILLSDDPTVCCWEDEFSEVLNPTTTEEGWGKSASAGSQEDCSDTSNFPEDMLLSVLVHLSKPRAWPSRCDRAAGTGLGSEDMDSTETVSTPWPTGTGSKVNWFGWPAVTGRGSYYQN